MTAPSRTIIRIVAALFALLVIILLIRLDRRHALVQDGGIPALPLRGSLPIPTDIRPNVAALTSVHSQDGNTIFVTSVRAPWHYCASCGTYTVDHITVEATADGGNTRWVRDRDYSDALWRASLSDVYIDSVGGNDENQGLYTSTPGSPQALKTWQELVRRWGKTEAVKANTSSFEINIHIMNSISSPDFMSFGWLTGTDTYILINGQNTATLHSGTLDGSTGFTAMNPTAGGGGTANVIKDSTGTLSWTPYLGKRIHFTVANSWAYILKDLGTGQARISVPLFVDPTSFDTVPTIANPANGAAYVVEDPVHVLSGDLSPSAMYSAVSSFGPFTFMQVNDVTLLPDPDNGAPTFAPIQGPAWYNIAFYRCLFEGQLIGVSGIANQTYTVCKAWGIGFQPDTWPTLCSGVSFYGGAFLNPNFAALVQVNGSGNGDTGFLDYYAHVQGGSILMSPGSVIRTVAVFDSAVSAFNSFGDAIMAGLTNHHAISGAGVTFVDRAGVPIWGNGNAGVGIRIASNALVTCETPPTITGTGGDFALGASGQARYFNETTGVYSTSVISSTWTLFNTAQPTGFGGHMHNPTSNSHFINLL